LENPFARTESLCLYTYKEYVCAQERRSVIRKTSKYRQRRFEERYNHYYYSLGYLRSNNERQDCLVQKMALEIKIKAPEVLW
jgi:hypothetical protein